MKVPDYRYTGHETFACRYAWLPKAARFVKETPNILTPALEDEAMVTFGVGKNMVRSIRFWAEAARIIAVAEGGHRVTTFGNDLLLGNHKTEAHDPFLEDIQTLWLIHWNLANNIETPIFAWEFLLSKFQEPELTASSVFEAIKKATRGLERPLSESTLEQQFEIFLHSYFPTRGKKGEVREDNLDCPLIELELLQQVGLRESSRNAGRAEPIYVFRREHKPEISPLLFAYCLEQFWLHRHPTEGTLSFQLVASGLGSPGQVFKLPEDDLRRRIDALQQDTDGRFEFKESASLATITRRSDKAQIGLTEIYQQESIYAC